METIHNEVLVNQCNLHLHHRGGFVASHTWELACKLYIDTRDFRFDERLMKPAIREARTFVEKYKELMEEEI